MSQPTQSPPGPDASPDEIEADIARRRARLADSVDALAERLDVKARVQEKVVHGSREVSRRVQALPRPAQIALAVAPVLLVALLVVRKARS